MGELAIEPLLLGWSVLALSTFATLLPVWLGITVLLNGERRTWGLWLAGGSLIIAGCFFAAHTAMVDGSLLPFPMNPALWFIGWSTIVLLPFAWYVVILWFGGYWENTGSRLRRRHRYLFPLGALMAIAAGVAVIPFDGVPETTSRWISSIPSSPIVRTPVATIVFPLFLFITIGLALDALRQPPSTGDTGIDSARGRARPQLVATTLLLLAVTALASYALVRTAGGPSTTLDLDEVRLLQWLDLSIVALIAAALLTLGRAIVSYEIFTGKTLPRRGLQRHLRNAIALGASAGILVASARYGRVDRMTVLLVGGIGLMVFYALVNWRSYRERQRFLAQLRPAAESSAGEPEDGLGAGLSTVRAQLDMLCANVLESSRAVLLSYSPTSPLEAESLCYPRSATPPERLPDRETLGSSRETLWRPLDPATSNGYLWCIPLWGQTGVTGALLLAEKINGGLYTQEEIEVARSTGEQIAALAANVELARRLIELQRRRISDRVMIDSQTRRILHDEVLPAVHSIVLTPPDDPASHAAMRETLVEIHRRISDILRSIPPGTPRALAELGLVGAIRHTVDTEYRTAFDRIVWNVSERAEATARRLRDEQAEVLYYAAQEALRNAARYARGGRHDRAVTLTVTAVDGDRFSLVIEDDGVGIDATASDADTSRAATNLPATGGAEPSSEQSHASPSTANAEHKDREGTGQGLGLHGTLMTVIGGTLTVDSRAGRGTRIELVI